MLINDTNIDIWYREYRRQYDKSVKYVKSRKGVVRGLEPLSRQEFKVDFISETFDNPKLSGNQIAQRMAKAEVYPQSWKQATVHAEAHARETGEKVTMDLINRYRVQSEATITDMVRARRAELKLEGYSANEINMLIGQEFYGSE